MVHALRGVSLEVTAGAFMSIIGPSGSGKTTLLNMIGCIDAPSSGSIKLQGEEITRLTDRRITDLRLHKIGFIFQTFKKGFIAFKRFEGPVIMPNNICF